MTSLITAEIKSVKPIFILQVQRKWILDGTDELSRGNVHEGGCLVEEGSDEGKSVKVLCSRLKSIM